MVLQNKKRKRRILILCDIKPFKTFVLNKIKYEGNEHDSVIKMILNIIEKLTLNLIKRR